MEIHKVIPTLTLRAKLNPDCESAISQQLTIFISKEWWKHLPQRQHAIKVSKTCRLIRKITTHLATYKLCEAIINQVNKGNYKIALEALDKGQLAYENHLKQSSENPA
jgi:hypothetical protein